MTKILTMQREVWVQGGAAGSGLLPSGLLTTGALTTPTTAGANGTAAGVLIAAPGAGLRIRLWMLVFGALQNVGAATIRAGCNVVGGSPEVTFTTPAGTGILTFPGGLVAAANTAINWFNVASVAGPLNVRSTAYYTIE